MLQFLSFEIVRAFSYICASIAACRSTHFINSLHIKVLTNASSVTIIYANNRQENLRVRGVTRFQRFQRVAEAGKAAARILWMDLRGRTKAQASSNRRNSASVIKAARIQMCGDEWMFLHQFRWHRRKNPVLNPSDWFQDSFFNSKGGRIQMKTLDFRWRPEAKLNGQRNNLYLYK